MLKENKKDNWMIINVGKFNTSGDKMLILKYECWIKAEYIFDLLIAN